VDLTARSYGMAKETRSPEALALFYLRAARGWTQKELAAALGLADEKRLCRYEKGDPALSRDVLDTLVAPLGFSPEAVDALLFTHRLVSPRRRSWTRRPPRPCRSRRASASASPAQPWPPGGAWPSRSAPS
jgi:transcriptional regulator with XRE-family HTH domain